MKLDFTLIALLSYVLAAPAPLNKITQFSVLDGVEGSINNSRMVMDTLNRQIESDGGAHANTDRLMAFITGADSQIDNAVGTAARVLAPLTGGLSQVVGNFLLGPFVQSATNGAQVAFANVVGGLQDGLSATAIAALTGNYDRLIALSQENGIQPEQLININNSLKKSINKGKGRGNKHKRELNIFAELGGIEGSINNHRMVMDTLNRQIESDGGAHANTDRLMAFITGADSQIDNAVGTAAKVLAPLTGGLSQVVGNFLLGPFVQSATNGAQVAFANVVGGLQDRLSATAVASLTGNYDRLIELAKTNNVDASQLIDINNNLKKSLS